MNLIPMKIKASVPVALVLLLAAIPASATVLEYLSIADLSERASAVIQGQVVGQRVISADGHLWTDSQVQVSEVIKGKEQRKVVVIRTLGGETANRGELVAGMARFRLGEQVLVFGRAVAPGAYVTVGACLGKFRVYKDQKGNQRVRRDFTGAAFARFDSKGRTIIRHGVTLAEQKDMALSKLLKKISQGGAK